MTADGRTPERKVSELDLGEKRGMLEIGFRQLVLSSTPSAFPSTLYPQHSTLNTLLSDFSNKVNTSDENKNKRTSAAFPAPTRDGNFKIVNGSRFYFCSM